jgi:hypothetical protein
MSTRNNRSTALLLVLLCLLFASGHATGQAPAQAPLPPPQTRSLRIFQESSQKGRRSRRSRKDFRGPRVQSRCRMAA